MSRAFIAFLFALLAALSTPAAASDLVLDAGDGFIISVRVNGATLRLRVDPAASGLVIINPDAARRARLRPEIGPPVPFIPGAYPRKSFARIGPVSLTGRTATAAATISGQPLAMRLIWFDRDVVPGADGVISVADLPFDRVVLRLGAARGPEAAVALLLDYSPEMGLFFPYAVGDRMVPIQFSVWRQDNMSTAAAGALLATRHSGAWRGDYARRTVSFGIDRPVRPMALAQPIELPGLSIGQFLVRTGDYRGGFALPTDAADPDEIVVEGASVRQTARFNLTLGRNQLARCSTLIWERAARRLTLSCAQDIPVATEDRPERGPVPPRARRAAANLSPRAEPDDTIGRSGSADALRWPYE